jgi:RHS repeat-associated protein
MPRPSSYTSYSKAPISGKKVLLASPHRFTFNNKENDSEMKGEGNHKDYGMQIYNIRLGRFLSLDPIYSDYPMLSSFHLTNNKPIKYIDRNVAGNPMCYTAEGLGQYYSARLYTSRSVFDLSFFVSENQKSVKVGSATVTIGRKPTNSTKAIYSGWNFFKPAVLPVGLVSISVAPGSTGEVKNTATQSTVTTIKKQLTPNTTYQRKVENSNGQTTTITTASGTVISTTGMPTTGMVSTSSDETKTVQDKGQVGISSTITFKQKTTTATKGSKTTTTTTAEVDLIAETPNVPDQLQELN